MYIFSVLMLGDPVSPARVAAVLLALGGVGLISAFPGTNNVAGDDDGGTDDDGSDDDSGDDGGGGVAEKVVGRCGRDSCHAFSIHTVAPFHQASLHHLTSPATSIASTNSPPLILQYVRTYGRPVLRPLRGLLRKVCVQRALVDPHRQR